MVVSCSLARIGALLAGVGWLVAADVAKAAGCDDFRGETITFVVPSAPGGGLDQYGRLLEPHLERHSGAEVIVSNLSGAGGLTGVKAIRDAPPDGRTIGIMAGNRLLLERLMGDADAPSVVDDFHLLGRIASDGRVLLVAADSSLRQVEDLWSGQRQRKVVAGVVNLRGGEAVSLLGVARLLAIEIELVGGFRGSGESALALLRGEVDLTSRTIETALPSIAAGEARPILLIADEPAADVPALAGVSLLGGADGVAVRRAKALGRPEDAASGGSSALARLDILGRLVVAPRALEPGVAACLDTFFMAAATDPALAADAAKAGRTVDVLSGGETRTLIEATQRSAESIMSLIEGDVQ